MAKELPYFQFEPAEYLTKDVSFCSLAAQGLFINICAYYWQRQCVLTSDQFLRRFNYIQEFNELVEEGVIDVIDGIITIKFLDNQFYKLTEFSKQQSIKGSLGGRPKKQIESQVESQIKAEIKPNKSQSKAIRIDNIRLDNIKEEDINYNNTNYNNTASPFSFFNSLINYGFDKNLVSDWLKVRKTKKATNTETSYNSFINEIEKRNCNLNEILEFIIIKNWSGFKWSWYDTEIEKEKSSAKKEKETEPIVIGRQSMSTVQKNMDMSGVVNPWLKEE
jgi:hypothetical protein